MTAPLSQLLPTQYEGANLAPLKPLLALKETNGHNSPYSKHYLADAIKEKYNDHIKRDEQSWREMVAVGQLIALFIEGKQILDWNPYAQAYTPRKLKRTDPNKIKAVNFMQVYCTMWQDKWGSSNPDIILNPLSNRDQDIAKARQANTVVNHLERTMYDAWYNYHEGLLAQIFGWYGNRVRTCTKNGKHIMKPILEEREVTIGKGWGKCHDCEYAGSNFNSVQISQTDSMPVCPECGSTAVYFEEPVKQIMPHVAGQEKIVIPEIVAEQLPFPACRWNPKYRAEESSWFIYEQEVDLNVIKRILGNVRVPEGETGNKEGMDVMRNLAQTGAPLGGRSDVPEASANRKDGLITEFYLSADDLYDIVIKGDEMTVDGQQLPVGQRASDIFPDGCCAIGLNGMSLLVGLYAEHHSNSVTSGVYHMKPLSGTGRGVGDAVEMQKRFNRLDSQNVSFMAHRATPATLHMAGAIKEEHRRLLGQPDVDIPVQIQNFPEVKSIRDLIAPLQGESVPGDMLNYTYTHLSNFMQLAYHTTNLGGINPAGISQDTATYAEIADQNSNSLFTPALTIKADVRLQTGKKAFELWCKNNPVPTFLPFASAAKSGARGIELAGEDVKGEYEWTVVQGSELPKNKLSKRRDMVQFYGLFGGIPGYFQAKQTNPQEVAETERVFDMDLSTEDYDEAGEVCRTRLEMAKGLLEQSEQLREMATAQFGVEMPPPDPLSLLPEVRPTMLVTEPQHEAKALWFANLLDTTEGQEMPDEERALVSAFVQAHVMLAQGQAIEVATADAQIAVAANAPIDEAEAEKQAVMQSEQQELQAKEKETSEMEAQASHDRQMEAEGVKLAGEVVKEQMRPQAQGTI